MNWWPLTLKSQFYLYLLYSQLISGITRFLIYRFEIDVIRSMFSNLYWFALITWPFGLILSFCWIRSTHPICETHFDLITKAGVRVFGFVRFSEVINLVFGLSFELRLRLFIHFQKLLLNLKQLSEQATVTTIVHCLQWFHWASRYGYLHLQALAVGSGLSLSGQRSTSTLGPHSNSASFECKMLLWRSWVLRCSRQRMSHKARDKQPSVSMNFHPNSTLTDLSTLNLDKECVPLTTSCF